MGTAQAMFFIIGGDGNEYGPVSADQIRGWITAGRANLETRAKREGTSDWKPLAQHPEFVPSLPDGPPLLPASPGSLLAPIPVVGVATEGVLAERVSRLVAAIVDNLAYFIVSIPGGIVLGEPMLEMIMRASQGEEPDFNNVNVARFFLGFSLVFLAGLVLTIVNIVMLSTRGQTIGKRILKIRVVRHLDGGRAGFLHGWLIRSFVPGLIGLIPYIGLMFFLVDICFIFGDERRCLHDQMAGTKVIKA